MIACAHAQLPAALGVDFANFRTRGNDLRAAGEVGRGKLFHHFVQGRFGALEQQHAGLGRLLQIMRRYFRRHADRNPRRTVQKHERQLCGKLDGLGKIPVVVGHEVDRPLIELLEKELGDRHEARFRIAHRGLRVAVARAEVSLPGDERVAHGKVLRHAHERVVDRLVAVRMIFAEHVAHDARRLHVLCIPADAHAVHVDENAALHGLLAVGNLGQRPALHDRHRVLEIGARGITSKRERSVLLRFALHRPGNG